MTFNEFFKAVMTTDKKIGDKRFKMAQLNDGDLISLVESGNVIHSSLDSQKVFSMIMENTNKVAGSVASTLFLLDETTDELVFCTRAGWWKTGNRPLSRM